LGCQVESPDETVVEIELVIESLLFKVRQDHHHPRSAGLRRAVYCGNVYHGQGDANQFSDQELIDWINTCNRQLGVCTLDWPFDPATGLIKPFGMVQMKRIARAVRRSEPTP
jgi:hypothetical protein